MSNEITVESKNTQVATTSPMQLIEAAINSGADIEKLERLMDLQERWESNNARKAFFAALSKFNAECPTILKKKSAHNSKYAPLGDIHAQIKSTLVSCGLSFRFEQDHSSGIEVTCLVSHELGHTEKATMKANADTSGSKSAIQAMASTVTYLMRYTLCSALGITTADEDMDGRIDNGLLISTEQERFLLDKLCTLDDKGNYIVHSDGDRALRAAKVENLMIANVTELQFKKLKGMITW
tara:strand:+ start:271 stop:987 length:717 start_codon:yes stop_codon:yes gene_type:complete